MFSGGRGEYTVNLTDELVLALRAFADGRNDVRTTCALLTRLGPAIDAGRDPGLMNLWDQAFTLLSEVTHGAEAVDATRGELRELIRAPHSTIAKPVAPVPRHQDG